MPLMKTKPTSPGRRSMVKVVNPDLHKGKPFAPLLEPQFQKAGRNNNGHITTRHKGGGHKHHYRVVDFKRNDKDGIPAKVERLEYDPNRSANIALIVFADGERRYIPAAKGTFSSRNIATLTICKHDQCNICTAVWIIFQALNFAWNAINAIVMLMTTTLMTSSDMAVVITTCFLKLWL